ASAKLRKSSIECLSVASFEAARGEQLIPIRDSFDRTRRKSTSRTPQYYCDLRIDVGSGLRLPAEGPLKRGSTLLTTPIVRPRGSRRGKIEGKGWQLL
ncbi:MAG: hypothetical protein V3T60_16470, partial [Candidatus Binatia bacterium]